ncbi:MAG: YqaE/Pmp3 family membrane protein [Bacteroidales bacterium]|nr:YqaE/Pmp3 family membrane protein [Bacteroidales bacterium]
MSLLRVILSIIFPPLAVYDRDRVPGVIAALVILNKN